MQEALMTDADKAPLVIIKDLPGQPRHFIPWLWVCTKLWLSKIKCIGKFWYAGLM